MENVKIIDYQTLLNEQQYKAAVSTAKHLRIIAGAGTGKTRALTYRIASLITDQHIPPYRIVAITFTNKVAGEMKERVKKIIEDSGLEVSSMPFISTYHGFCLKFLRAEIEYLEGYTRNFTIADDDDQKKYLKDTAKNLHISDKADSFKSLVSTIKALKCKGIFPGDVKDTDIEAPDLRLLDVVDFYKEYQRLLKRNNTLDFDDILIKTYRIIKSHTEVQEKYFHRYTTYLVDEYQDTNDLQYKLLKEFLGPDASLTVVGDPDQTIYTWRGANANLIRDTLARDFADLETIVLNENYRSTQSILDSANLLIAKNYYNDRKNLKAASGLVGEEVTYRLLPTQDLEASFIADKIAESVVKKHFSYKDVAIIYRSNYLSRALEGALTKKRIPYRIYGGYRFFDRASVKSALAYLKIVINPQDDASVLRVLQSPTRGLGEVALGRLIDFCGERQIGLLEAVLTHLDEINLSSRCIGELSAFREAFGRLINAFNEATVDNIDVKKVIYDYFELSGFIGHIQRVDAKNLEKEGSSAKNAELDNVNELIANIASFFDNPNLTEEEEEQSFTPADYLSMYLSNVMLLSQQDDIEAVDAVSLMTVHVSKGLEFPCVFVSGLVEGVFPTSHAIYDLHRESMEEERRMLYVAITRARRKIYLSSFRGYNYIMGQDNMPSSFLKDLGLNDKTLTNRNPVKNRNERSDKIKSFDTPKAIEARLNDIRGSSQPMQCGLVFKHNQKYVYQVGDKIVSTSYGLGEVRAVDGDKITAYFPSKADNKEVRFLNGLAQGYRPFN